MKKIYLILFVLFAAFSVSAQSLKDAEDAYVKEDYKRAAQIYEALSDSAGVSSELYYNLGNSYYKQKNYPKAILNYERALLLSPSDEDVKVNLEMAKMNITDKIDLLDRSFVSLWLESVRNLATTNSWAVMAIVAFVLFIVGCFLYIFNKSVLIKKIGFFGGIVLFLFSIFANVASYRQKQKIEERNNAIIMAPSITVKSSPADSGTELFILHEGTKVQITDKVGEWFEIKIDDGNRGWIPTAKMEII